MLCAYKQKKNSRRLFLVKLKSLYIEDYKNLKEFNINFNDGNGLSMIVGNNGTGKSNILEVISGIFHDIYRGNASRKISCDYTLEYVLDDANCKIENKSKTLRCYVGDKAKAKAKFLVENTPNNVIGLYSGEDDRLWTQFYESYYKAYIQRIKKGQHMNRMRLMLINKYYWNISLLTLLLSNNEALDSFIKDELGITQVNKIVMSFDFKKYDDANELLKTFIDRINSDHKDKVEYTIEDLKNSIFNNQLCDKDGKILVDANGDILVVDSGINDVEVFRYFTQASMPKGNKIITKIDIYINEGITLQLLSEGEKKLILVKTVLEILSDEKTLILMDEPDAHLHEVRKKNLYTLMSEYDNRQIIIASHSPTFIDIAQQEQIKMLKCDDKGYAVLYDADKLELIRELTGSRINAFLEKPIIYCEGTETSIEYILYPLLFPNYKIIPSGGHEEVIYLTKMYNRTFGDDTHYAIGIIDWDFKTAEQLSALKTEKIFSLKVVEIENVLMDLTLLNAAKNEFCSEDDSVEKVKQALFDDCIQRKEYQATKYTANNIVSQIKSGISPEGGTIDKVKNRVREVCDITKIDALYKQRLQCLDEYLREGNFDELIKIYDFGHKIDRFLKAIVDNYQNRILKLIQKRTDLQEELKNSYYPDIE